MKYTVSVSGNVVTVTPKTNLAAKSYSETIIMTTPDGASFDIPVNLTVAKATLTATYEGETIYVGKTPALTVHVTGFVNGEAEETAAGYTAPTVINTNTAAGTYPLTPTGGATDNYDFTYVGGVLTILSSGGGSSSYIISVNSGRNGSVSVSPKSAPKGSSVTIIVKPDSGYELDRLTVTDKNGDTLKPADKGNGKYTFPMPGGKVAVEASFVPETGPDAPAFTDVFAGVYYHDAVLWAAENGITTGVRSDTFAPEETVTHAQAVTFLHRTEGTPTAGSHAFTDVAAAAWFNNAMAWITAAGITNGTVDKQFSPAVHCARGQIVTFLYSSAQ